MTRLNWLQRIASKNSRAERKLHSTGATKTKRRKLKFELLEERAVPAVFNVSLGGDDTTGDGSAANPFRTVQKGITAAAAVSDGDDFVQVEAGTYATPAVDLRLSIPNNANLTNLQLLGGFDAGQGFTTRTPRTTIYIPQTAGDVNLADVDVLDANSTIDGFHFVFDGNGVGGTGGTRMSSGVLSFTTGLTFNDNTIEVGLGRVSSGARSIGIGSTFNSNQTGLSITNNLIQADGGTGASFNDFAHGIFLNPDPTRTTNAIISGNTITGTTLANGIVVDTTGNLTISGNTITRTGTGDAFNLALLSLRSRSVVGPLERVSITENNFDGNGRANSIGIQFNDNGGTQPIQNIVVERNNLSNLSAAIVVGPGANQANSISATIRYNSITDNTVGLFASTLLGGSTNIDASRNWWGDISGPTTTANPGGLGQAINDATGITFAPWLIYSPDSNPALPGVQLPNLVNVTPGGDISEADNDFRRLQNAFGSAVSGQTFDLSGSFDWTGTFSLASYMASTSTSDGGDIRGAELANGANNVTITSSAMDASILGAGDFADENYGSFLFADDSFSGNGGPNALGNSNLTIENLEVTDFESAFVLGWNATGTFNNTLVQNNTINVAGDDFGVQNIAIYFWRGIDQQYINNQINFAGDGTRAVSTGARSFGFQNGTTGGTGYDGLHIDNNTFQLLPTSNSTEIVYGIWENSHNDNNASDISLSNNKFIGRQGADDFDRAFVLSSQTTGLVISDNEFTDVDNVYFASSSAGHSAGDRFTFTGSTLTRVGGADGVFLRNVTDNMTPITVAINWTTDTTIDGFTDVRGLNELSTQATGASRPLSGASDINAVNAIGLVSDAFVSDSWGMQARFTDPDGVDTGYGPVAFGFNTYDTILDGVNAVVSGGTVSVLSGTYAESVDTTAKIISLSPQGSQTGQVTVNGDLTLDADDTFVVQVNGGVAGTDYDQVVVNGTVTLGGATLDASGVVAVAPNQPIILIDNDGNDPIVGTFAGLAEGDSIIVGGVAYFITYQGGDGNDVGLVPLDFGDAPAPYATTLAEDGARHIAIGPLLGSLRDSEADGVHSAAADADNLTDLNDEDGVVFSPIFTGTQGISLTVNVSNVPGKLDAWIDLNGDGVWGGVGEQIFASQDVQVGSNFLTFDVPANAVAGLTYARFRISTAGGLSPTGAASDGEVEDYQVTILNSNDSLVNLTPTGQLQIVGTGSRDIITMRVRKIGGQPSLQVFTRFNGIRSQSTYLLSDVTSVLINAGGGDDKVSLASKLTANATVFGGSGRDVIYGGAGDDELHGGSEDDRLIGRDGMNVLFGEAGNDRLTGGRHNDILVGGEGNDRLSGGRGLDLLLGGNGIDRLSGGRDDDLLVAGPTSYDVGLPALGSILAEWTSNGTYAQRTDNILNGTGSVLGGTGIKLSGSGVGQTVFDDGVRDRLAGNGGQDFFYASADDRVSFSQNTELVEPIL